jgi:hypothetical protein
LSEFQKIFEAIDSATAFMEGCPLMQTELKLGRRYVEKIAADPNGFDECSSDQVIRLLHQSADEMEACNFQFMAADLRDAASTFKRLGYPKGKLHLVG